MAKKITIDFDNDIVLIDMENQEGVMISNVDKLKVVNALGEMDGETYMTLCKSPIIGIDFEKNLVKTYKAVSYDAASGSIYQENLLKEMQCFKNPGLSEHYKDILDAMQYEVFSITENDINNILP